MRFLFVKPQRIGDALILTPTLRAVKEAYPQAEIWVLIRRGSEGILAGCPEINGILTLAAPDDRRITVRSFFEGVRDIWRLRRLRFDFVIELSDSHRGRLFACLARGKRRYTMKLYGKLNWWEQRLFAGQSIFPWEHCNRVERDFYSTAEFLPLRATTPPPLVFDQAQTQPWPEGGTLTHYCLLQIGTWKEYERWPRERWKEVASYLLEHFDQVVVSTGSAPREVEEALWLRQELGNRIVCTLGKTTWAQVAGLLYAAGLYVGLDTGAMHLAAACGCPIVAKFTTTEDRWFPWLANYRAVVPESYRDVSDPDLRRKMRREPKADEIESKQLIEACEDMLHSCQAASDEQIRK